MRSLTRPLPPCITHLTIFLPSLSPHSLLFSLSHSSLSRLPLSVQGGDLTAVQGQTGPVGSDLRGEDFEGWRQPEPTRHQGRPDGSLGHKDGTQVKPHNTNWY